MTATNVDGTAELIAELDRRSKDSSIAGQAPRSPALYRYLYEGMTSGPIADQFQQLSLDLIQRLGIWWSQDVYTTLPVMVPWCIRDRSCRYDQGPESWGSPRSDGYLRDDNSIIKKLPLPLFISGPKGSPYHGRRPWRGFTACHIWRDLPSGELAGADPWLYSFVPNLIWLPSWLAPLTDRQGGDIQGVLQRTSIALFRDVQVRESVTEYVERAWSKLPAPTAGHALAPSALQTFDPVRAFFTRRLNYIERFVRGCDDILSGVALTKKLICTRYTSELPTLDPVEIRQFRDTLEQYRVACYAALLDR
mgnify:CR=1 FL=1